MAKTNGVAAKKISLKGLAVFMTASAARQRSLVREFKYPGEDEAHAKILYYREARDRIAAYHRAGHGRDWLLGEAAHLETLAASTLDPAKTRLNHNARALREYARHFAKRRFEVQGELSLGLRHKDVVVSVSPDLHVREGDRRKIVKLEFNVGEPTRDVIRIISQGMFEAGERASLQLASSDVLYLDVPRGMQHRGARLGSRLRRNIEASCMTLSAIWDDV